MLKKGHGKVREKLNGHPVETLYLHFLFITMLKQLNEGDERVSAFREKIHFGVRRIASKVSGEAFLGKYAKQSQLGRMSCCKHDKIEL